MPPDGRVHRRVRPRADQVEIRGGWRVCRGPPRRPGRRGWVVRAQRRQRRSDAGRPALDERRCHDAAVPPATSGGRGRRRRCRPAGRRVEEAALGGDLKEAVPSGRVGRLHPRPVAADRPCRRRRRLPEGGPAQGDLILNIALGTTLVWLPLTFGAIGRSIFLKYKFTDKRLSVSDTFPTYGARRCWRCQR